MNKTTEKIVEELKKIAHEYPCCEFTCNNAVERLTALHRAAGLGLSYAAISAAKAMLSDSPAKARIVEDCNFIEDALRGYVPETNFGEI